MPDHSWRHPIHAQGIRSPQISLRGDVLTDKQIHAYALAGRYGETEKLKAQAEQPVKRKKLPSVNKQMRALLKLLLKS